MKKFVSMLCLAGFLIIPTQAQNKEDQVAIKTVAMEYLQAWYEGNEELMSTVIHSQMSKKIVFDTGNKIGALAYLTADDLLVQTKKKRVQETDPEKLQTSITILDNYNNTAMVKAETHHWIDYLHMARISGNWKIVNILWELKYEGL